MTSSLRNSIHRRNHKERSQLAHRSKLGILEKHADYVKRARDYHSKQDRLTRLKQKASERNKDEFYFSMSKEKTQGGVHVKDRGNVALPIDIVKVLKTQDQNYVRTMRAAGLKKIDKIKNQLMSLADLVKPGSLNHGVDDNKDKLDDEELEILREAGVIAGSSKGNKRHKLKHIVFVDNEEQAQQYAKEKRASSDGEEPDAHMDTQEEVMDLGWKVPDERKTKKRKTSLSSEMLNSAEKEVASEERRQSAALNRKRLLKELSARLVRDKQLRYTEREFEMQRLLMGKGGRQKLSGVEKAEEGSEEDEDEADSRKGRRLVNKVDEKAYKPRVYKWRSERKR